jgi:hypothetical protein
MGVDSEAVESPAKKQIADVQGISAMELGGFEPPTSWVRCTKVGGINGKKELNLQHV